MRVSPTWSDRHQRPRVLIERSDTGAGLEAARVLECAGYTAQTCRGPIEAPCPLLSGERCPLVEGADLVWNGLGPGRVARDVAAAVAGCGGVPVVIEIGERLGERPGAEPAIEELVRNPAVWRVPAPVTPEVLVATVGSLIARHLGGRHAAGS